MLKYLFNKIAGLMECNFFKKKTLAQVFCCKFSEIFKKTYFVEHARNGCLSEMNQKNVFTKYIHRETPVMASFLVQPQTCGLTVFRKRWFSMKIRTFHKTSVLQNNAARLLLISCDNFNALLALSVINQFSHSM